MELKREAIDYVYAITTKEGEGQIKVIGPPVVDKYGLNFIKFNDESPDNVVVVPYGSEIRIDEV